MRRSVVQAAPVWEVAQGEALPAEDVAASQRSATCSPIGELTARTRSSRQGPPSWAVRLAAEELEVDVEFLVERLRRLCSRCLRRRGGSGRGARRRAALEPGRERHLVEEFRLWRSTSSPAWIKRSARGSRKLAYGEGCRRRAWRQYLLRVAYLALTRILLYRSWEDVEFVDELPLRRRFRTRAYEQLAERSASSAGGVPQGASATAGSSATTTTTTGTGRASRRWSTSCTCSHRSRSASSTPTCSAVSTSLRRRDRPRPARPVLHAAPRRALHARSRRLRRARGCLPHRGRRRASRGEMLDFATGSGGFLVEAARRIIDDGGIDVDDPAICSTRSRRSSRVSPAAKSARFRTTSPRSTSCSRSPGCSVSSASPAPSLRVRARRLHTDTLTAKGDRAQSLEDSTPGLRADHGELAPTSVSASCRSTARSGRPSAELRGTGLRPRRRQPAVRCRGEQQAALRPPPCDPGLEGRLPRQDRLPLLLPLASGREAGAGWTAVLSSRPPAG